MWSNQACIDVPKLCTYPPTLPPCFLNVCVFVFSFQLLGSSEEGNMSAGLGERKHPDLLYYRMVFTGVALDFPLSTLANSFLPNPEVHPAVAEMKSKFGVTIIPFKLQSFKEKLPSKYGHLDFFMAPPEGGSEADLLPHLQELQTLFVTFVSQDLPSQVAVAVPGVSLHLVGNVETHFTPSNFSGLPLLKSFAALEVVSKAADPLKAEVFLQTKVDFTAAPAGEFNLKNLSIPEMAWLRSQMPTFPTTATSEDIQKFFSEALAPLNIRVSGL